MSVIIILLLINSAPCHEEYSKKTYKNLAYVSATLEHRLKF